MKSISVGKRTGGLLFAVLLAALATAALISYVRGVEGRAFRGAETVSVYVARDTIPAGMSIDEAVSRGAVTQTTIPRKVVADGAVASLDQLRGQVAAVTIVRGEQIVATRFSTADQLGSTLPIPVNHQAMAVEVETPPGVAGFILPGAQVSVIAHLSTTGRGGSDEDRAQFLLQGVQVLSVGQRVATVAAGEREKAKEPETLDRVLLTLAVTPAQAEKLAFAIWEGDVYFTLLPQGQKPVKTPGRTSASVFK